MAMCRIETALGYTSLLCMRSGGGSRVRGTMRESQGITTGGAG